MTRNKMRIELLQAEVDENDQSFFRLLVNDRNIKYVTIDPGLYSVDDVYFGPSLVSLLPTRWRLERWTGDQKRSKWPTPLCPCYSVPFPCR